GPAVGPKVKALIEPMAEANPLWGAPRIHGELEKLGIEISERTVSRLIPRRRKPPSPTWRTFIDNHIREMVSIDFLTVPTVTFRVLFGLVALAHYRRRVAHFNVTEHPTAAWTARQIIEAFPEETAPRFLLRDRDHIYGEEFRRRVAGMKIEEVMTAPHSPWQSCASPKPHPACIFNKFIRRLAVRICDAVPRLQRSRLPLPTPATALLSALAHPWRATNEFAIDDNT